MSHITDSPTNWRSKWVQAQFRDAIFYVETDQRGSGRRVALHQYPKRNTPYAEDMGRAAIQIQVNGYVIGRGTLIRKSQLTANRPSPGNTTNVGGLLRRGVTAFESGGGVTEDDAGRIFAARDYLTMKMNLIDALEKDGPGMLRLPMQYQFKDLEVMVMNYTVTESRERGGVCVFQMQFVEFGDPRYRSTINTAAEIMKTATSVENVLMGLVEGRNRDEIIAAMQPYTNAFNNASQAEGDDRGLAGLLPPQRGFSTGPPLGLPGGSF